MKQLKDWQTRQNTAAYNIAESDLVNNIDTAADVFIAKKSIAKQCDIKTINNSKVLKLYHLGKEEKQELSSKLPLLVVTFSNFSIRNKFIKTAFKFKNNPYSVSMIDQWKNKTCIKRNTQKK